MCFAKKVIRKLINKSIDLVTNFIFQKVLNQNSKHNKIIENINSGPIIRSAQTIIIIVITKIEQYKFN